jgi:hypothetical protein
MGCYYFVLNIPCAQFAPKNLRLAEYARSQFRRSRNFGSCPGIGVETATGYLSCSKGDYCNRYAVKMPPL